MNRKTRLTYLILGVLLIGGLTYSEMNKPRPVNWSDSFSRDHHIPFGSLIFYQWMKQHFGDRWQSSSLAPYEWFKGNDSLRAAAYLLVNDELELDEPTREALLLWVGSGNRALLSANTLDAALMDTLGIGLRPLEIAYFEEDSTLHRLVNPHLIAQSVLHTDIPGYRPIHVIDSLGRPGSLVLGTAQTGGIEEAHVNFARIPWGKGEFFVHLYPYAFTNYILLKGREREYAGGVMSYFENAELIHWDEHLKTGRSGSNTPLYIFLSTEEFRYAYYLAIAGTLLYVVFQGKRKQRPIPVVKPLENQSVNFTRTLGDMYLDGRHDFEIAEMKWEYFLEFIRSHLYISTERQDDSFFQQLAARSNQDEGELRKLFSRFDRMRERQAVSREALIELDQQIHSFKEKCHGTF